MGYDEWVKYIAVTSPTQIKSATDNTGEFSTENDDIRFRIAEDLSEEREIEARARANGTWLKAPNGKPTNLKPKQWVQVRTQAFKNWFGDWEKAANHQYVGKIELGGKEYYVRFTVQEINTRRRDVVANQLHSAYVSDVEIYSADTRVNTGYNPATANTNTTLDTRVEQLLEEAKETTENSSKVVDENGEPMVMFHGTKKSKTS